MDLADYSDDQIMQEMLDFFASWKPEDVLRLGQSELKAWKKHALSLRQADFWWVKEGHWAQDLGDRVYERGVGWPPETERRSSP